MAPEAWVGLLSKWFPGGRDARDSQSSSASARHPDSFTLRLGFPRGASSVRTRSCLAGVRVAPDPQDSAPRDRRSA